jgi:hypothetical protein
MGQTIATSAMSPGQKDFTIATTRIARHLSLPLIRPWRNSKPWGSSMTKNVRMVIQAIRAAWINCRHPAWRAALTPTALSSRAAGNGSGFMDDARLPASPATHIRAKYGCSSCLALCSCCSTDRPSRNHTVGPVRPNPDLWLMCQGEPECRCSSPLFPLGQLPAPRHR